MMLANIPAVFFGDQLIRKVPMRVVRAVAATLFVIIGLWVVVETAGLL